MKPVVQKPRKDGFWVVYIRFTHNGQYLFYKTSKVVSSHYVVSKSEITDDVNDIVSSWIRCGLCLHIQNVRD